MDSAVVCFQRIGDLGAVRSCFSVKRGGTEFEAAVFGLLDHGVRFADLSRTWPLKSRDPEVTLARPHAVYLADQLVLTLASPPPAASGDSMSAMDARVQCERYESARPVRVPAGFGFLVLQWTDDEDFQRRVADAIDKDGVDLTLESDGEEDDEDEDEDDEEDEEEDAPPPPKRRR
jgi:hypothetical protein